MAVTREFALKRANDHGAAFELTGVPAVIAGAAMAIWGAAFLTYALYPNAPMWRRDVGGPHERGDS